MGEHSKALGPGAYCAYCGEDGTGKTVEKKKVLNFEDWYPDEGQLELDSARPYEQQLVEYMKKHGPEAEELMVCPMCGDAAPEEYGEILNVDQLWMCTDCETVSATEEDAERCCEYSRRYAKESERYSQQRVEEARRLLESQGFSVHQPMDRQPTTKGMSLDDIVSGRIYP